MFTYSGESLREGAFVMSTGPHVTHSRLAIATALATYQAALEAGKTQADGAEAAQLPRATLEYWRRRQAPIPADPTVVAFFESPAGVEFLHQLVVAAHFCMSYVGNCGIRVVCQYLELTGLAQFMGSSYGAQQQVSAELERLLDEFGRTERRRLGAQMSPKSIAICEDEAFHPQVCVVGIEPVSNFLLVEQYVENRKADTWTRVVEEATADVPVTIMQVTSDQGAGICAHATQQLGVHQSPDIFHVQHDVTKGTSGALAAQVRKAASQVADAQARLTQQREAKAAYDTTAHGPGRPPQFESRIAQAADAAHHADVNLQLARSRQAQVAQARRQLSTVYHPFDLETGAIQEAEAVEQALRDQMSVVEQIATEAALSDRCQKHLSKAKRVIPQLVATIAFFWVTVRMRIDALSLDADLETMVYTHLLPAMYLRRAADKTQDAGHRQQLRVRAATLLAPILTRDGPWARVSHHTLREVEQVVADCVEVFQRSSSCVEGRNGQLAFRRHALHRISPRRLAALTVVHNYYLTRPDGTTAAERFFGTAPQEIFSWLLERVQLPGRPAQKRPSATSRKTLFSEAMTER
jgi:hypothetical protein